jgi:hypothetical protein
VQGLFQRPWLVSSRTAKAVVAIKGKARTTMLRFTSKRLMRQDECFMECLLVVAAAGDVVGSQVTRPVSS